MTDGFGRRDVDERLVPWSSAREAVLELVGDRRIVLLGEASHGSAEFYRERAALTRLLVEESGFTAVAVEADWPDAYRVNRYVHGASDDADASAALGDLRRFPAWMWRNTEVVEAVEWLRGHNEGRPREHRVGFYGLDLYSLRASMEAVVAYLQGVDPAAAAEARMRYACFDHVQAEGPEYAHAVALDLMVPCEDEVVAQLIDLRRRAADLLARDGMAARDEFFVAERNAALVHDAERYYRAMYRGRISSWNLRDRHMVDTLDALATHLSEQDGTAKVVVWAHNSHVGDARATELGAHGELTLGQLVRQRWGTACVSIGFTTDHGTVTAASEWGGAAQRMQVRPAMAGSWESILHQACEDRFLLGLAGIPAWERVALLERAIGVVYRPQTERSSHWFHARMAGQFDAVVHLDRTTAVEPLERSSTWDRGEAPETYPTGL